MEILFEFAITSLTFTGNFREMMRPVDVALELGRVRKRHYRLSERGGISKLVLDELMRERLRLEESNRKYREYARP